MATTYKSTNNFTAKKLSGDHIIDFGDYTMKIGKHKGKSIKELIAMPKGKEYLYWFRDNVVNDTNEKFYGKIMKVVEQLKKDDEEEQ